ncbi:M10 family metallopeptidase C-terminal domain-containing protein [Microvirga sp. ACRRW]|uniref:M10 family metallopeptidase n=1 Tax=Microvirga sp. ACRRW TaxID=2918205 RepID=UPI001EF5821D|nr:M10 family metallopeptidase [Microvirga sp. ACRRW]MCG7392245.1 M10 family metallopeptidase C-terminal domain-containing protein [Microvirga sp. ACRRW]
MSGYKWPSGTTISYGFPTTKDAYPNPYNGQNELESNFISVTPQMKETIEAFVHGRQTGDFKSMILTPIEGFTNLKFVQHMVPDSSTHMLIASTSVAPTAHAYYPGSMFGEREGDIWFGQQYPEAYGSPINGTYGHMIAMHEFGHALGLKHSFDLHGKEDGVTVPWDKDFYEYSIMSYSKAPYVEPGTFDPASSGSSGGETGYALPYTQTFMMLDIAALQQMYGANYTFRSDDTVYKWDTKTGETYVNGAAQGRTGNGIHNESYFNKILQTIWDGGGIDTYDLSNYATHLKVSLAPGGHSAFSDQQRVQLGYFPYPTVYSARGNVYNALLHNDDPRSLIENAKGGSGHDTLSGNIAANHLWGNDGKDTLSGGAGHDTLDGGNSIDTATFSGARANYTITKNGDGSFTVADNREDGEGKDTLISVNFAKFNDQVVTLIDPSFTRTGTARSDRLTGDIGNDKLSGLGGNDRLNGEAGNDRLSGGSGKDAFVFTTALNKNTNVDTISDFNVKDDSIRLENAIFRKLTKMGELNKSFFKIGPKAGDANDFIVYNKTKGVLSYDADGSRGGAAIEFAKVKPGTALTHADFFVV